MEKNLQTHKELTWIKSLRSHDIDIKKNRIGRTLERIVN